MRKAGTVAAAALALCRLSAVAIGETGTPAFAGSESAVWSEGPWPFPMDQWGKGKAYTCSAVDCGTQVTVYIRAKVGFCNCATGVADDAELDRISDFELIGNQVVPQGVGRPISVAWMNGRSRAFGGATAMGAKVSVLSVGFNDKCDAIVATAIVAPGRAAEIEPALVDFLNSGTVLRWAAMTLGL